MIIKREKAFLISYQILLWQLLKILSRNVCRSVWRICMLILRIWGMHGKWWLFIWNSPHEVTWVFVLGRLLSFLLLFFSLLSCKKRLISLIHAMAIFIMFWIAWVAARFLGWFSFLFRIYNQCCLPGLEGERAIGFCSMHERGGWGGGESFGTW